MTTDANVSGLSVGAARRLFWATFAGTLLLKVALAAGFPFTGDEAFFFQWGVFPAWGYSDHPPMVGWLLALLHGVSDSPWVLRSGTLLVTSVIALGIVDVLRRHLPAGREAGAWLAGAVYLALPWSWLFVLVTTDTPLILFMALSAWCYLRADAADQRSAGWYALAGLFLGLAFLSKYFAVLLGLACAAHILGWRRPRGWALPLMAVTALPSIAVNLGFNATHGWPNVMFNLFNRHEGAHGNLRTPAVYAAMMAYLLTPWLLWQGLRGRWDAGVPAHLRSAVTALWLLPFALFAVVSVQRGIGLHWVLGFVPLFMVWVGLRVEPRALRLSYRATLALSLPHLLLVAAIAWAPLSLWQKTRFHDRLVFMRETPALTAALTADLPAGATLMARSYTPAAMLAFRYGRYVPVFGVGRHHARQDDQIVDFRAYDGRPLRVLDDEVPDLADYRPFFDQVRQQRIVIDGVSFWVVDGAGFRFAPYRAQVLAEIAHKFHRIPRWLPLQGNPFCERYGFTACSPGRGAAPLRPPPG